MRQKLLILLSSLNAGGAETQTVHLVNNIDTEKFEVTLRYFDKREALLPKIDLSRVNSVECLNRKGRFDLSILEELKELVDKGQFDVILCISPYPLLYGYLVRLFYRRRYTLVTAIHQTLQKPGRWERMKADIFRVLLNRCDLILFVCKNQLDYWVNKHHLNGSKSKYIYNGIDVEYFSSKPSGADTSVLTDRYNIGEDDVVLVNVAGFRVVKKQEDLVHAAGRLREKGYPVKVLLVGDGPRRQHVESLIRSLGLQDHAFVTGLQSDVRPFLNVARCFVISSHQETFSLAALEAMAAGLPVVMTDVGGAGEMVESGVNGLLFPPGDIDALVENIEQLIESNSFAAMGIESRKIVSERFTLQKMVDEYERALADL